MRALTRFLKEAAAPTLDRIRRDRDGAPAQLKGLLDYVATHLFDAEFDAKRLQEACGVRDNSWALDFHRALSLPPYAYIEDCRFEIACRLLRDTELKVWQIAQQLGYSTIQVFSRAFDRWSGLRPTVFRRQSRSAAESEGEDGQGETSARWNVLAVLEPETLRLALRGGLAKPEADELSEHLVRLYPESFARPDELPSLEGVW